MTSSRIIPRTWGELMALPEAERKAALIALTEQVFAQMAAKEERYLDQDYAKSGGSWQNYETAE